MEILGKKGEVYQLDEGLRDTARALVEKYSEVVGHIDLQRIVFVRVIDLKLKKNGKNWLGKCMYIKDPVTIIPRYVVYKMASMGLIDMNQISGVEDEILEHNYIIMLNDAAIAEVEGGEDIEALVLLHELMHVPEEMEGVVQHDVQDFSWMVSKFGPNWPAGIFQEGKEVSVSSVFEEKLKKQGFVFSKGIEQQDTEESD